MLLRGLQTGAGLLGKERREMKPIEEMTGLELREAAAVEVMGELVRLVNGRWMCRSCDGSTEWVLGVSPPAYESSIEAAFQVVDACRANGVMLEVTAMGWGYLVNVQVLKQNKLEFTGTFKANSYAKLPLAIARASLKAVRAK